MPRILAGALDVLREEAVMAKMVKKDFAATAGKIGDVVTINKPTAQTTYAVTPGPTPPAVQDNSYDIVPVTVDTWKASKFHMTEREATQYLAGNIIPNQIKEAARAIAFDINADILSTYKAISAYAGTAGTNPFTTNVNPVVDLKEALDRQFTPDGARKLVIGYEEQTAALKLAEFKNNYQAGDSEAFRRGNLGSLFGMDIFRDGQRPTHTAGAGSGYLVNNGAGYAAGTTSIVVDTGTGALNDGDILTFAGHVTTYAVNAYAGGAGTITLKKPLTAAVADNEAITKAATHKVNLAFDVDAFALVMRVPDSTIMGAPIYGEHMVMTDPVTGIPLKLSYLPGYHLAQFELSALWGADCIDYRRAAILAG